MIHAKQGLFGRCQHDRDQSAQADNNGSSRDSTSVERNVQTSESYRDRPIEISRYNETNYYAAPANNAPGNGDDNSTVTQTQNWNLQDPSLYAGQQPINVSSGQDPIRRDNTPAASNTFPDVININVERHEHHHYTPETDITGTQTAPQPIINTQLNSNLATQPAVPGDSFTAAELKRRSDRELASNINTL